MFEDSRLNIFMAVIREGSFTKAAKSLGISQPAVSQNIAEIERELDLHLFERSKTEMNLTADGAKFKEYAEQILYWYDAASQAFRKVSSASLFREGGHKRDLYIAISDGYSCHIVPNGSKEADIDIRENDGSMSVTVHTGAHLDKGLIF